MIASRELECDKRTINLHNFNVIFKYGNITEVKASQCIVQQCNCITINKHGLSPQKSEKYPWADIYKEEQSRIAI